jgi:hypothetical protein
MRGFVSLVVIALVLAGSASAGARQRPTLVLLGSAPVTVRGLHFSASERVVLVVRGRTSVKISLRTAADGTFRLRLPVVGTVDACHGVWVQALGAKGDRASVGTLSPGCGTTLPGSDQ